jgi:hypothetical protein
VENSILSSAFRSIPPALSAMISSVVDDFLQDKEIRFRDEVGAFSGVKVLVCNF